MNRHFRRRVEREWKKIKLGKTATKFLERNGLFEIPHVVYFQAVKVGDDVMCVYTVGMFEFKDGFGFPELVTVCQFVHSLLRVLGHVELGFVTEEDLEKEEEAEIAAASLFETIQSF
jgi:hypothetical protein